MVSRIFNEKKRHRVSRHFHAASIYTDFISFASFALDIYTYFFNAARDCKLPSKHINGGFEVLIAQHVP